MIEFDTALFASFEKVETPGVQVGDDVVLTIDADNPATLRNVNFADLDTGTRSGQQGRAATVLTAGYFEVLRRPKESIILRGADGRPLPYGDAEHVHRMRRDLHEQNQFVGTLHIAIDAACEARDDRGRLYCEGIHPTFQRRAFHRVFNRRWTQGGRWYGPFWQNVPKDVRKYLLIGGEPVIEHDIKACHLRLLCARAGRSLQLHDPGFDPYAIPGHDRQHVKRAFNIMLNASCDRSAFWALVQALPALGAVDPVGQARGLTEAVRLHFPGLVRFWCTGIGLCLQRQDADICARVQRRLRHDNVPVLGVHDGFIVPKPAGGLLEQIMDEEMERA